MPNNDSKGGGSQIGQVLGGIAAIIAAIGGIYAVVHKTDPKPDSSPAVIQPVNPPKIEPDSSSRILPSIPTPRRKKDTPTQEPPKPAFKLDGYWSGTTENYHDHYVLSLRAEDDQVKGILTLLHCDMPSLGPGVEPISTGTWDGRSLTVSIPFPPKGENPASTGTFALEEESGKLAGTYHRQKYDNVTFHRGRDTCPTE